MSKMKRKLLSLAMTAAMITTLFAGLTISASATVGEYTVTFNSSTGVTVQVDSTTVTSSTTASDGTLTFTTVPASGYTLESVTVPDGSTAVITENSTNNYTISNVEGDTIVTVIATTPYSGQTSDDYYTISTLAQLKTLASTVNAGTTYSGSTFILTANIPIAAASSSWAPIGNSAHAFAGKFDGRNNKVTWSGTTTGGSYWGVFGNSSGIIANLKTAGSLTLSGTSGSYVSPLVGYSSGSVYNCVNSTDFSAENMDNVGGVVGAMENTSTSSSPIYLQYCGNTGNITASKRVGGVVGAVYCSVQSNVVVDQCYCKNCTITTTNSSKVWSGGLAGYVKGKISNSYTDNICLVRGSGRYLSGLVGILNGSNPAASAENCYANVVCYTDCEEDYDRPFVGSVDRSSAVVLTNCYWTETDPYFTQPVSPNWGTWIDSEKIDEENISWADLSIGSDFNSGSHPTLKWETTSDFLYNVANGASGGTPVTTNAFYVDQTWTGVESGTLAEPYKTLDAAVSAANGSTASSITITVAGTYTFAASNNPYSIYGAVNSSDVPITTIVSDSSNSSGSFITVASGATVYLGGLNINGTGYDNTIKNNGTFTIRDCASVSGGDTGIDSSNGNLTINRSSINATSYSLKVGGTCTLNAASGQDISLSKPVFLNSGKYLTIDAELTSIILVVCENPVVGSTLVASVNGDTDIIDSVNNNLKYSNNVYGFSSSQSGDRFDYKLAVYSA